MKLQKLNRVTEVKPLEKFMVQIRFEDNTVKIVDLEPFLRGSIFEPLRRDPKKFRAMKIEGGTIAWENGADIDPDVLYYDLDPAWKTEPENIDLV
jgi:hypothetical protein